MCRRRRTRRRGWYRPFRFSPIRIPAKPEFRIPRKARAWPRARRRPAGAFCAGASERYADRAGGVDLAASLIGPARRTRRGDGSGICAAGCILDRAEKGPHGHHPVRSGRAGNGRCVVLPRACGARRLPAPVRAAPPRAAAQPATRPMSAPRPEANGPLSIVPDQDGAAPAPRVRTALARPTEPNGIGARRGAAVGRRRLCRSGHLPA